MMHWQHPILILIAIVIILGVVSCEDDPAASDRKASTKINPDAYIETGDFDAIRSRGKIRFLVPQWDKPEHLPRKGFPIDNERFTANKFAEKLGLKAVFVPVSQWDKLIPALLEGKGDVIAAGLSVTDTRAAKVSFTVPLVIVRERIIARVADNHLKTLDDLRGRTIAVRKSSSYRESLEELRTKGYTFTIEDVPENLDTDEIVDGVARGQYDLTVADSNIADVMQSYRTDIRSAIELPARRAIAWAVRPDASQLLEQMDMFLTQEKLVASNESSYFGDFDEIKKRKVLRVLTRNSASTYFLWRGELLGFEYELARHFAQKHGLRIEMIVPPSREELIPWLEAGKGDLVAASLTITEERSKKNGIAFSRPYNYVSEVVVVRKGDTVEKPLDLSGRTVVVRKSSSYWETLQDLQQDGLTFKLEPAPEEMETEEIIAKVADGEYDITVADSHILDIEMTWRDDIEAAFAFGDPVGHGWVVRSSDSRLLEEVNRFIKKTYRGTFYNITKKKYFESPRRIRRHVKFQATRSGKLSPYDDLAKKYAEKYMFDWRMIVAIMHKESRFDPEIRSFAGAVGLMQVMPRTARQMGITKLLNPELNILAGVKYLSYLRNQFEDTLSVADRMWFTLASYNAGYGHVADARRLARQLGKNPNRWFGNVEDTMLLLSKPQYARYARHGYCRGREPVAYVKDVQKRYLAYAPVSQK